MTCGASKINHRATTYIYWIFLTGYLGASRIKHTSFGTWSVRLPRSTTGPQFTHTGFFNQAFWGLPHQTHQFWHMTTVPSNIKHSTTIYIYWIFWLGILGPATPISPVLAYDQWAIWTVGLALKLWWPTLLRGGGGHQINWRHQLNKTATKHTTTI